MTGPDGSIYISDDKHGRIWHVAYQGNADAAVAAAPVPKIYATASAGPAHLTAAQMNPATLPVPPGATREQVVLGDSIFHGKAAGGTCSGCHGSDAAGSPQAPSLVSGHFFVSDGSLGAIVATINDGVPKPHDYEVPMPPKGGAPLTKDDVAAVAAYVWAISHVAAK